MAEQAKLPDAYLCECGAIEEILSSRLRYTADGIVQHQCRPDVPQAGHCGKTEKVTVADLIARIEVEVRARKAAEAEVEDEIQRRDRYHDAITEAHVALGGDGEWRAHVGGSPEPPNSGHLHLDVPVMARQLRERIAALEAELAGRNSELQTMVMTLRGVTDASKNMEAELAEANRLLGLYRDECHVCGVESCRHRGADHGFRTTEEHWAEVERELAEAKALHERNVTHIKVLSDDVETKERRLAAAERLAEVGREAVGLFASCVKGGERWSEQCESVRMKWCEALRAFEEARDA